MGPELHANLPSRPKFSWDAKSPPWTDRKGDQEVYRNAVRLWQTFHSALPDSNSNKIPTALQAICLKSQLYRRAKDLCSGITEGELTQVGAVDLIVCKIYQKDALSVVSEAYRSFTQLWNTRRSSNENMKNFESRFSAQVAKFNSISSTTKLPECITALMLLSNSAIDDSQRVSVMAAAAPSGENLNSQSTNYEFLSSITYQSVASVIKQCDKTSIAPSTTGLIVVSSAGTSRFPKDITSKHRYKGLSPSMKYPCDACGKYGHWKRYHNHDGSLPSHIKAFDTPGNSAGHASRRNTSPQDKEDRDKTQKRTMSFNMATLPRLTSNSSTTPTGSSGSTSNSSVAIGPLVDDGAPYSAIGMLDLHLLADHIDVSPHLKLNPIPKALKGHTYWQYGIGEHASPVRRILGSVVITAMSDDGRPVCITHLVLDGSSQWVIGRNVTRKANVDHINNNALTFFADGHRDQISVINSGFLSYIPLDKFTTNRNNGSTVSSFSAAVVDNAPWGEVKKIIDKVHKHVCGHACFNDYKLLLERNGMWSETIASYLTEVVNRCAACCSMSVSQPNRKVSISSLSKSFNEILCVDHLYLDDTLLVHMMDLSTRYSSVYTVISANLTEAIVGFEASRVSQFWYADSIRADKAFQVGNFKKYMEKLEIPVHVVPPGRLCKNAIESKHNIIRTVFHRLKEAGKENFNPSLAAYKAVSISNDLYGNDTMSACEQVKGFTCPVMVKPIDTIAPDDVITARDQMQARRKLALILRSRSVAEVPLVAADLIEVYRKKENDKRGKWSEAKSILSVNQDARSVTVPGRKGQQITAAFEDTRLALPQESLAKLVQDGIASICLPTDLLEPPSSQYLCRRSAQVDAGFSSENANVDPTFGDSFSVFGLPMASFIPALCTL